METHSAATNARPRRTGRRASMSALPADLSDMDKKEIVEKLGKTKEQLYNEYKAEKKARLKQHEEVEANFRKQVEEIKMEEVSGLAEQEEEISARISLQTFAQPRASRRMRRASMGVALKILDAPESPTLELEEIEKVVLPASPTSTNLPALPLTNGGIFTGDTGVNAIFNAEALAGWKTVTFQEGPLGIQLEPTAGKKACRVTGFLDTAGHPSQARASGKIEFNDVIVKVNGALPKTFDETLTMLTQSNEQGLRLITFRPAFGYELEGCPAGGANSDDEGAHVVEYGYGGDSTDEDMNSTDYGYGYETHNPYASSSDDDMEYGYGYEDAAPSRKAVEPQSSPKSKKKESTSIKKESKSSGRRRASIAVSSPAKPSKKKHHDDEEEEEEMVDYGYAPERPSVDDKPKKKRPSRRASLAVPSSSTADVSPKTSKSSKLSKSSKSEEFTVPDAATIKKKRSSRRASIACSGPLPSLDKPKASKKESSSSKSKSKVEMDDDDDPLRKLLGVSKKTSRRASIAGTTPVISAKKSSKSSSDKSEKKSSSSKSSSKHSSGDDDTSTRKSSSKKHHQSDSEDESIKADRKKKSSSTSGKEKEKSSSSSKKKSEAEITKSSSKSSSKTSSSKKDSSSSTKKSKKHDAI